LSYLFISLGTISQSKKIETPTTIAPLLLLPLLLPATTTTAAAANNDKNVVNA